MKNQNQKKMNTVLLLICAVLLTACGKKVSVSENSDKGQKVIYSMGVLYANQLKDREFRYKRD